MITNARVELTKCKRAVLWQLRKESKSFENSLSEVPTIQVSPPRDCQQRQKVGKETPNWEGDKKDKGHINLNFDRKCLSP